MAADSKKGAEGGRSGDEPLPDKDVESRFKRAVRNLLAAPKKPTGPDAAPRKPATATGEKPVRTEGRRPK